LLELHPARLLASSLRRAQRRHIRAGGVLSTGPLPGGEQKDDDMLPVGDLNGEYVPALTSAQCERIQTWMNTAYDLPPEEDEPLDSGSAMGTEHDDVLVRPSTDSLADLPPPPPPALTTRPAAAVAAASEQLPALRPVEQRPTGQASASQPLSLLFSGAGLCAPPLHMRASYIETACAEEAATRELPNVLTGAEVDLHRVDALSWQHSGSHDDSDAWVFRSPSNRPVPVLKPNRFTSLMPVSVPDDEEAASPRVVSSPRGLGARPPQRPGALPSSLSARLVPSPAFHSSKPQSPLAVALQARFSGPGSYVRRDTAPASPSGQPVASPLVMLAGSLSAATGALYRASEVGTPGSHSRHSRRFVPAGRASGRIAPLEDIESPRAAAPGVTSGQLTSWDA
jgi:hypothetical protein